MQRMIRRRQQNEPRNGTLSRPSPFGEDENKEVCVRLQEPVLQQNEFI